MLSIVSLTWDQLHLTKKFIESIRKNTDVPYELIMVDNGSRDGTQEYIKQVADKYHFFERNTGFSHGFNKGLSLASREYIAICNNDTEFPPNWFRLLVQSFDSDPKCGLVFPCYTKGLKIARRWRPGKKVIRLTPFEDSYPSGVAILSKLMILRDKLGGFSEDYEIASGEDADLCFKVWTVGLDIYIDERVLVKHKGKSTVSKIPNWQKLFKRNAELFRQKWKDYIKD